MLGQAWYRVRQFSRIFAGAVSQEEVAVLKARLNLEQQRLFFGMDPLGRRHCLNVYHTLAGGGYDDPDLLRAALLHDVGKGRMGVLPRVARVLLQTIAPPLLDRLARRSSGLGALVHHAQRGAALVEATGAPKATVEIIRGHETGQREDPRLLALRRADSQN